MSWSEQSIPINSALPKADPDHPPLNYDVTWSVFIQAGLPHNGLTSRNGSERTYLSGTAQ